MSFSADWLRLREPADHRSRSRRLLERAAKYLSGKNDSILYDLGAGAGSNLRGTVHALGPRQRWMLVDYDAALLSASLDFIAGWADASRAIHTGLEIEKDGKSVRVEVQRADLAADPAPWGAVQPDMITSAALFDLVSEGWIDRFCAALAKDKLPLYTTLVHDAETKFSPAHPADREMVAAFEQHFGTDKGFGPSVGGKAVKLIAKRLRDSSYTVEIEDSPWILDKADAELIGAVADGWAQAVRETKAVSESMIAEWLIARKAANTTCIVGHKDLLALPG